MSLMAFSIEHVRPPRPLRFAASDPEWEMGQSTRHLNLCTYLREMLGRVAVGSSIGCDQFVYWDASDDTKKCAPDAFVKLGVAQVSFESWKTWEKGTPELCVEIVSPSDAEKLSQTEKLARFHAMGVREVVFFDPDAPAGRRLRAWDWIDGDLVERVIRGDTTPCVTLRRWFHVGAVDAEPIGLFLAEDEAASRRIPTHLQLAAAEAEARQAEAAARRVEAEARQAEAAALRAAEARIVELEAELRKRG
jgi:hypothetical protein